jgi:alkylation response protein AidB-like acyl-CoA dehydrogenase
LIALDASMNRVRAGLVRSGCDVDAVEVEFRRLLDIGSLDIPPADAGHLPDRWRALERFGAADLCVAKLAESHCDALQILREAEREPAPHTLYAVWASASGGTGLTWNPHAGSAGTSGVVSGLQRFGSGARMVDRALVTAHGDDGVLLVDVAVDAPGVTVGKEEWATPGMAGTGTLELSFENVAVSPEAVVGPPGWYLQRPGFWIGGIGVAAVWLGAAKEVLAVLAAAAARDGASDAVHVHHAAAAARVLACDGLFKLAAERVGHAPAADHRALALAVREIVERCATEVMDRCARALGPIPLVTDDVHARRVTDLVVYLRQHGAERDLVRLSQDLLAAARAPA